MHALSDWITPNSSNAIRIHHNGDWSGEAYVEFTCRACDKHDTPIRATWTLSGRSLLDGSVQDLVLALDKDERVHRVPASVIARAVMLAYRNYISRKVVNFGEGLL